MGITMSRYIVALGATLVVIGAAPTQAAQITYTDAACSSFAVTGAAPNFTLTCSKLACSLSASPASPLSPLTAATTLTTACSPSGNYTYAWSKSPGNDARCPPAPVPATSTNNISGTGQAVAGCVYQVDVNGGANGNGVATISLDWTANAPPPAAAPTGCGITANPASLPTLGGAVTLTASCGGGGAPTSYDWTGFGIAANTTVASQSTNITATTAFTVTPRNAGGAGNTAGVTVSVAAAGGGAISCTGFTTTRLVDLDWGTPTRLLTSMSPSDAIVVRFTTGSTISPANNLPKITGAEWGTAPSQRTATLSDKACDFGGGLAAGASGTGQSITLPFSVGPNNTFYYPGLSTNTTYYVNVKNPPNSTCLANAACDMFFELQKPPGL